MKQQLPDSPWTRPNPGDPPAGGFPQSRENGRRRYKSWVVVAFNALLALIFVAAGLGGAAYIRRTAPMVKPRPPQKTATVVRTVEIQKQTTTLTIPALGKVVPARQVTLKSQVNGTVTFVHPTFTPGGRFPSGKELLRIDPRDHELTVDQKEGQVARARYELQLERGRQAVARRELTLIDGDQNYLNQIYPNQINQNQGDGKMATQDRSLALRKPHLQRAQAELKAAQADLEKARLNLQRTRIVAPFNALILERNTNLGAYINPQDRLATLVDTDAFWIQANLPADRLKWIKMASRPDLLDGSPVQVRYGNGQQPAQRRGHVLQTLGDIEPEGNMARLLIQVKAPLDAPAGMPALAPLLLGTTVNLAIEGPRIEDVVQLPRPQLRGEDQVWILDGDQKLEIRQIEILWKTPDHVWISKGLNPGEKLITSDIGAPVSGMPLQPWETMQAPTAKDKPMGQPGGQPRSEPKGKKG